MTNLNNLRQNKTISRFIAVIGLACIAVALYFKHINAHLEIAAFLRFVFYALLSIGYSFFYTNEKISAKARKIFVIAFGLGAVISFYDFIMLFL